MGCIHLQLKLIKLGVPDAGIGATGTGSSAPCTDFGVADAGIGVDDAGIPEEASCARWTGGVWCSTAPLGARAVVVEADFTSLIKTRLGRPASVTAVAGLELWVGSLADVAVVSSSLLRESTAVSRSSVGTRVRRQEVRLQGGPPGFLCCRIVAVRQFGGVDLIASNCCSRRRGCRCLCLAAGLLYTHPGKAQRHFTSIKEVGYRAGKRPLSLQ